MKGEDTSSRDIFIMYSKKDEEIAQELYDHLSILQRNDLCHIWWDGLLKPGDEWMKEIEDNLRKADIILVLLSPHFIQSNFSYKTELELALKQYEKGEVEIVPFLIKDCVWEDTLLSRFQLFPNSKEPLSYASDKSKVYKDLSIALKKLVLKVEYEEHIIQGDKDLKDKDWANAKLHYLKASDLYKDGYTSNRIELKKKIKFCKNELEHKVYFNQGEEFYELGDWGNALECYERAERIKPSEDVIDKIGRCKHRIRNYHGESTLGLYAGLIIVSLVITFVGVNYLFLPPKVVEHSSAIEERFYILFKKDQKWGAKYARDSSILIEPLYDTIILHSSSFFILNLNGKWGAADNKGIITINAVIDNKLDIIKIVDFIGDIN